ncbi:MAG: MBL fold metallo-hydrolase [Desulfuromonadales bacterium]|nr:MBL fold metallo-hydrolase [Chloroflexota bacterium]MCK4622094.1 MBL fold metallo-hydrolase [Desulfuromonadales bacterium]
MKWSPSQEGQVMDQGKEPAARIALKDVCITILYDNNPYREGLGIGWGFSCVIKGPAKTILFDTGGDGSMLLRNMEKLGISPLEIDLVVLSHIHGDHVGGLHSFLQVNPEVTVCLPKSFPEAFKNEIKAHKAKVVEISEPARICKDVHSTGPLGDYLEEQSLIIDTDRGLIIITGCAHPGIVRIVEKAKELVPRDVRLVLGGFHLLGTSGRGLGKIISRLKELGVYGVGPCHCSGDAARELFQREWKENYLDVGVGRVITAQDLK